MSIKHIIISPPFGTFIAAPWATSVLGTFTLHKRRGKWRQIFTTLRKTEDGWVNNIGLKNPGLNNKSDMIFKFRILNENKKYKPIFSLHGTDYDDWVEILHWLSEADLVNPFIELNLSCPNVVKPVVDSRIFTLFADSYPGTIVKLPPTHQAIPLFNSAYSGGINNFHCCNTLPTERGGESGYALKPHSLKVIEKINKHDDIHVIGGGGIYTPDDVRDYYSAGVQRFSLSSIFFTPWKVPAVKRKIEELSNV